MRLTLISPKRRGRKRKSADVVNIVNHQKTTRTSLLTKMRTLKKRSSEMMMTTTTTSTAIVKKDVKKTEINIKSSNIITSNEENNFPPVISKKRRIAHTPKIDDDEPQQIPIIRKSLRSASKSPGAARNSFVSSQSSHQNLENSLRTRNKRERNSQEIKETRMLRNSTKVEETKKEGGEIPIVKKRGRPKKEVKVSKVMEENSANENFSKPVGENLLNENSSKTPQKNSLETNSTNLASSTNSANLLKAKSTDKNPLIPNQKESKSPKKNSLEARKLEKAKQTNSPNKNQNSSPQFANDEEMKSDGEKEDNKLQEERENFQNDDLESPLSPDGEIDEENSDESDTESESTLMIVTDDFNEIDQVNESWKIASAALNNMPKSNNENVDEKFSNDSQVSSMEGKIHQKVYRDFKCLNLSFTNPMFQHMNRPFSSIPKKSRASQTSLEKRILYQINRLVDDKDWTSELHFQVVEEIWTLNDIRTTAKCILNVLTKKCTENESMDSTHTPPAPMMTRTQQKIITLISALEEKCKQIENLSIFEFIFHGINYSLFRLGYAPDKCVVEGLSRIFTCMSRLKKDRERARLFIIDALYCYRFKANAAIFVVLTCWSEVFPNYDSNIEILPKCMAYIIYTIKGCYEALKKLLTNRDLYNYPLSEMFPDQLATECLSALEKKHERSIDTAIILLSKSMGPKWTQKMIIQGESGLKQLIVGKRHKSPYDAFTLLGNVMRSFPEEDNDGHLSQIVEQLCDLLDSDEGSDDHLEGVASALLCFSKYRKFFCKVSKSLISWTPKRELRDETKNKFQFFSNSQPKHWWYDFIQSNYTIELPETQQVIKKITQIDKKQNIQKGQPKMNNNKMKKRTKNIRKKQAAAKIAMKNNTFTSQ
ncbi:uncharacterized protein LOC122498925 [Leptopilina heterotoma]|uniref:uncharacterized protein LOC122498925 n=1 Tax=Leptopilina heterotoma TaxID=63436 RepID=UPI001CA99F38|nr:uncharacterized protein LOC122498925 [Leptopilina heterotoma]